MGWRREAPGSAFQYLIARRNKHSQAKFNTTVLSMEEDEFVDAMRLERVSERRIEMELETFRSLKAERDAKIANAKARLLHKREKVVSPELEGYIEFEGKRKRRLDSDSLME